VSAVASAPEQPFGLSAQSWQTLCTRVRAGECVPVIGGQLRRDVMMSPEQIAAKWAEQLQFPLSRSSDLAMVAEFARVSAADEDALMDMFASFVQQNVPQPSDDQLRAGHPFRLLAELPLDLYLTTTFDDLMVRALQLFRPNCRPKPVACRWRPVDRTWVPDDPGIHLVPSYEEPVVFHLHGRWADRGSMVLTESDHMVFAENFRNDVILVSDTEMMLPPYVRTGLAGRCWFFVGYGAADRNLRQVVRALVGQVVHPKRAVAVQLQKDEAVAGREEQADSFLTSYFGRLLSNRVDIVLQDAQPFLAAIREAIR
jgi:hypothetical protein